MRQRFSAAIHQLWPLIISAGLLQAVGTSVFARNGFFAQIYHLSWPTFVRLVLDNVVSLLWGGFGMALAGVLVAEFGVVAILTAVLASVLLQIDITQPLAWPQMGADTLLAAVVSAWLLRHWFTWRMHAWQRLGGCVFLLVVSGIVGQMTFHFGGVWSGNLSWLALPVIIISRWFGLSDFQLVRDNLSTLPDALANLQYVMAGNSLSSVPHRFTLYTVYAPFGMMGGIGMGLALVIAWWWVRKKVPLPELLGALVNQPALIWLHLPIYWDWRLLIPMLLAPLASMGIASAALALNLMPPVVYSVPTTTPSPLFAFLGTNGNWAALGVSLVCLAVSTLIYLPFLKGRVRDA